MFKVLWTNSATTQKSFRNVFFLKKNLISSNWQHNSKAATWLGIIKEKSFFFLKIPILLLSLKACIAWHWCNHVVCSCVRPRRSDTHVQFLVRYTSNWHQYFGLWAQVSDLELTWQESASLHLISFGAFLFLLVVLPEVEGVCVFCFVFLDFSHLNNNVVSGGSWIWLCQTVQRHLSGMEWVQTDVGRCWFWRFKSCGMFYCTTVLTEEDKHIKWDQNTNKAWQYLGWCSCWLYLTCAALRSGFIQRSVFPPQFPLCGWIHTQVYTIHTIRVVSLRYLKFPYFTIFRSWFFIPGSSGAWLIVHKTVQSCNKQRI